VQALFGWLSSARVTLLYLFDIDGTLLSAHGSGRDAFDAVFHEHHGITDASRGIRYGGKTDPGIIDEIYQARLGRDATAEEHAAFLSSKPEVVLGIATGNVKEGAAAKLGAARLREWFVLGGYGCDSRERAKLVAAAIERGKRDREVREVIVVGDTIHDISAARACGATVCAVTTGSDTADALAHADAVFSSLRELPAWHTARFG
jgi:phosphoglycolate phosphatase